MLLAGQDVGLFAYHALALDLLHLAVGVRDDPVAVHEAGGQGAGVADRDGVGEHVALAIGLGLVGQIQ